MSFARLNDGYIFSFRFYCKRNAKRHVGLSVHALISLIFVGHLAFPIDYPMGSCYTGVRSQSIYRHKIVQCGTDFYNNITRVIHDTNSTGVVIVQIIMCLQIKMYVCHSLQKNRSCKKEVLLMLHMPILCNTSSIERHIFVTRDYYNN